MGINSSKAVSNVLNEIDVSLSQNAETSAQIKCSAEIGNITGDNWVNCNVLTANRCGATANSALGSVVEAATSAFQQADQSLKTALLPGINVSSSKQDIQNRISQKISQECAANVDVRNAIAAGNIDIRNCRDSTFKNVNAGTAMANCGVRTIVNDVQEAVNKVEQESSTGGNLCSLIGLDCQGIADELIFGSLGITAICCICCCVIVVLIVLIMFVD